MVSGGMQNGHSPAANGTGTSTPAEAASIRSPSRYSQDMKYYSNSTKADGVTSSNNGQNPLSPPKLQSSYSANDVPTMKSNDINSTPAKLHAQQHFHNHQASLGRIPVGAFKRENSGNVGNASSSADIPNSSAVATTDYSPGGSVLQASVPPFNPSNTQTAMQHQQPPQPQQAAASSYNPYAQQPYYPYGAPVMGMTMAMQGMNMGGPQGYNHGYADPYPYGQSGQMALRDSQARVIQQRRQTDGEGKLLTRSHNLTFTDSFLAMNRFANVSLESLKGEIYALCKDQHGCRFLQKQLEGRDEKPIHLIWEETNMHVIELMTDPFGNYLCQKLLEFCNDEERTVLIRNASHDLVRIALNQHGTRALQKMIEFISTPEQVQIIVEALRNQVVELIQDLNGNHVIQKCLNKLSSLDAQFIFDAVGLHCVDVGTHRHGCCVLQRCIDHASGDQKAWLIRQISNSAFVLVQDPFGNYVVQYILDLNEPVFTEPLVHMFKGKVGQLSRQKFSSNVIEKCLRCAQEDGRNMLIDEMLTTATELERLLRDSYANYVVQTAIDYATGAMKQRLIDAIRPILPSIRGTPYGRRIQAKIQGLDSRAASGENTPVGGGPSDGQLPLRIQSHQRSLSNANAVGYNPNVAAFNPAAAAYGQGGPANGIGGRVSATTFPTADQIAVQGLGAHPGFAAAYEGLKKKTSGRGAGGNYF